MSYKRRGLGGRAAPQCHPRPDAIYTVSWLWGHQVRPQPAAHMCRFMWRARWSEREKARSQRWHWKGRCPVCLR